MRKTLMMPALLVGLFGLAGCGGEYMLTVPDQVAPKGDVTATVLRLQRNEFAGLMLPVAGAPMQLRVEDGPLIGAYTDKEGYAAANVPVGDRMGKYYLRVFMQDTHGRELRQFVPVYIWDARMSVVAVEYDALKSPKDLAAARDALTKIASNAYIIYFTGSPTGEHAAIHRALREMKLPDGAVVGWQQESWHFTGEGAAGKMIIESRLVSPLGYLRTKFPQLKFGLCSSAPAAKAFSAAAMKVVVVGQENVSTPGAVRKSWGDIAKSGL